jgi:hypothetical protein
MPQINNAEIVQRLQRRFNLRGGRMAFDLDYNIVPVVLVEDLREPTDDLFTERLCMGHTIGQQIAATFPKVAILNPADSGVECKLLAISTMHQGTSTGLWQMGFRSTLLGAASTTPRFMNARFAPSAGAQRPSCQLSNQATAGLISAFLVQQGPVFNALGTSVWTELNIVLPPGEGVEIDGADINTQMICSFVWIESSLSAIPPSP